MFRPSRKIVVAVVFLSVFFALNRCWSGVRGTWVENVVIDQATVKPAAALIHVITPAVAVQAVGSRLKAPGGGLNILNGCEGIDILFMLLAAFAALWRDVRRSLAGIVVGTLLIFAVNQLRVVGLFYAARSDVALFDLLHTTVTPLVMMSLALGFFAFWTGLLRVGSDSKAVAS